MTLHRHTTLTGEVLEYELPTPEHAAFLDRVIALASDPRVSEDDLIDVLYGKENPLLDTTMFADRGAVTREVFDNPLYHVLVDFLGRKRQQLGKLDMGAVEAAATLSVAEAAAELGVTPSAVRQAIQARRLAAVKVGNAWRIDPRALATFLPAPRGPEGSPALELRIGSVEGKSFRIKLPGFEETARKGHVITGVVRSFRNGAVAFSGKKGNRLFVIEPSEAHNEFRWGPFYIRGRYRVVEKINQPEQAGERFRDFVPEATEDQSQQLAAEILSWCSKREGRVRIYEKVGSSARGSTPQAFERSNRVQLRRRPWVVDCGGKRRDTTPRAAEIVRTALEAEGREVLGAPWEIGTVG